MLKRLFITVLILLLLLGAAINYLLSDTERLKTELGAQLSGATGYQVDIEGKLNWQVMPSIGAAVAHQTAQQRYPNPHRSLRVGLNLSELIKSPEDWTLGSLIMDEVRLKDADFRLQRFALQNFVLGQATPFQAQILVLEGLSPAREGGICAHQYGRRLDLPTGQLSEHTQRESGGSPVTQDDSTNPMERQTTVRNLFR